MKKLYFLILFFMSIAFANAQTFTYNGIKYNVTSTTTVEVGDNTGFSGAANIPTTVTYNSQTYNVTSISDYAFLNIDLISVVIPNSVTSIGNNVFRNCFGLASVTIGNSVTAIGVQAFFDCPNLTTVNCYIQNPITINPNVFGGFNQAACTLNVPVGSEAAYDAAPVWTNFNPINGNLLSNDSFVKNNFSMYPNPSNGVLNISLENNLQLEKVSIYNQLGQIVKTASTQVITTSELAKGSYYVEVITNNGKTTKQLILN